MTSLVTRAARCYTPRRISWLRRPMDFLRWSASQFLPSGSLLALQTCLSSPWQRAPNRWSGSCAIGGSL